MLIISFLKRLFGIGQAEVNSAIESLENPIKMTEQGIRDMKKDLDKSMESLAQVKSMAIRARKEVARETEKSADYERKAMLLLKRAQGGEMDVAQAED